MRLSDLLRSTALAGLLLFCLLATADAQAQTGRIVGTVTDAQTGDPLPGANIVLQGTSRGTASNPEGQYTLQGVPAGNQVLLVTYIGYQQEAFDVRVVPGQTVTLNITLAWEGVVGDEVVITAQAAGQTAAINQQLASNTITNIVSRDRIRELPDVNAAESIGRLPGVSIQRSGGEATKVAIRGLSPKYANVTVNGVRVPSTGADDRDVDLSLISSNMLDGIEVSKAITPDMDADATAGSVDLRLRRAPSGLEVDVMAQGGYNQLQSYYGNYKVSGTLSNRFFSDRLGIIATVNTDRYDRSADKFNGDYRQRSNEQTNEQEIVFNALNLREEVVERARTGASILFDYQIPKGIVSGNTFFNRLTNDGIHRVNGMSVVDNRHYYNMHQIDNRTSILTAALGIEQDFEWIQYDVGVSRTASRSTNPRDYTWNFVQESSAFNFGDYRVGRNTHPTDILEYATSDSARTGLADVFVDELNRDENQTAMQLNVSLPYRLSDSFSGYVKVGGKLRWLDRMNDQERVGRNGIQYGSTAGNVNRYIMCVDEMIPDGFNGANIGEHSRNHSLLPIYILDDGYSRENFLDGEYPLGYTASPDFARQISDALYECGEFREVVTESRGSDYSGEERYQAAYVMTELNVGRYLTFIPGVRWEGDWSRYQGQRYRELVLNNEQAAPTDLDTLITEREIDFWLPMFHAQIKPNDWLQVRLARTKTLQRPGFMQYAPISRIDAQQQFAYAGNSQLRPSVSTNYDASVSIYERRVGLFTASAFHKQVQDHIIWVRFYSAPSRPVLPGLNIPDEWIVNPRTGQPINPRIDTFINNEYDATYRGFELDWQTNFWYLPSVLKGIVLNLNYTHIVSDTEYQGFTQERVCVSGCGTPRPIYEWVTLDTTRTGRMVDQPAHIANVTVGYDIGGFSARVSYLFQTDRVSSVDAQVPVLDQFSGTYSRFDATLRQQFSGRMQGLEIYANLNNLNNRSDRSFQGGPTGSPTYIEYYGFSMDIGARYRF